MTLPVSWPTPAPRSYPPAPLDPATPPPPPPPDEVHEGPGLPVRAVWFVLVGWWLSALLATIAWFAMITIVGLPLGFWLINRIPTFTSLRPRTLELQAVIDVSGITRLVHLPRHQVAWPVRGLWFLVIGWWASALVMAIGWTLFALVITLPIGLLLFNRVPFVASLYRY